MPAPATQMMAQMAKSNFLSKGLRIPNEWQPPCENYASGFNGYERQVAPNSPLNLFREYSLNKYHVDAAKTVGDQLGRYIDGICDAICNAVDKWMKMTSINSVSINGAVGQVLPGSVIGPVLMPLIMSTAPVKTSMEMRYSTAIAAALSEQWQLWQAGLTGTLMYPPLAACAGPTAPPTPNTPVPLAMLSSSAEAGLSPSSLKNTMSARFSYSGANHAEGLFDAMAKAIYAAFQNFKITTIVQNVLGCGAAAGAGGPVQSGAVIPAPGVMV